MPRFRELWKQHIDIYVVVVVAEDTAAALTKLAALLKRCKAHSEDYSLLRMSTGTKHAGFVIVMNRFPNIKSCSTLYQRLLKRFSLTFVEF